MWMAQRHRCLRGSLLGNRAALSIGACAGPPHLVLEEAMRRSTPYFSLAMAVCLAVFLNQCAGAVQPMQVEQQKDIAETTVEIYHDESTVVWWDGDTYPITLTCELRKVGGGVVATQEITWTVPTVDEYSPEPIVEPISLTWSLAEPLQPGWYEEFCMAEIDGHYGRSDTERDGNFYEANRWRAPVCYGLFFKGR